MLKNKVQLQGQTEKSLVILSVPVNTLEQFASIHKEWRAKYNKALNNFDRTHFQHLKELRKKVKAQLVILATSTNPPACTICRLVCKFMAGLKSYMRHKHHK